MLCAKHGSRHACLWNWLLSDDWELYLSDDAPHDNDERSAAGFEWAADRERNKGRVADPGPLRVYEAYYLFLVLNERPPLIGELLRKLGINKPRRTQANQKEWEQVNNRERVIRKTLRKFDLSLLEGKRGRRWQVSYSDLHSKK